MADSPGPASSSDQIHYTSGGRDREGGCRDHHPGRQRPVLASNYIRYKQSPFILLLTTVNPKITTPSPILALFLCFFLKDMLKIEKFFLKFPFYISL